MGQFRALKSLVAKVFERKTRRGRRPALRVGFRPTLAVLEAREVPALTFQFDYSYDTNGFFSSQDRKDALERAGTDLAKYVTTTLGAITPAGSDTWNAYFANPADGTLASVANPSIASGVVRVYAGGRDFTGGTLAATTLGDRDASGSQAWVTQVATRGQGSDYSTWGGSVSFDTTGLTWYTGTGQVSGGQYDLYSVALHELGHTLGFANSPLSPQFQSFVSGASFTGPQAVFANAGTPALDTSGGSHWADTTTWNAAKASMDPTFTTGERRPFSGLDYAALADIGWDLNLVVGTRWNDTITLTPGSGNTVQVNITSVSPPPPAGRCRAAGPILPVVHDRRVEWGLGGR